jgi:hypothetical protein
MTSEIASAEVLSIMINGKLPPAKATKYLRLLSISDLNSYRLTVEEWLSSAKRTIDRLEGIVKACAEDPTATPLDKENTEELLKKELENRLALLVLRDKVDEVLAKLEKKRLKDEEQGEAEAIRRAVKAFGGSHHGGR